MCVCVCKSLQSCPTLHNPMDYRLLCPWNFPGKITGGIAMPASRGSSQPRDWTCISCLLHWQVGSLPRATWEALYVVYLKLIKSYMSIILITQERKKKGKQACGFQLIKISESNHNRFSLSLPLGIALIKYTV